MMCFIGTAGTAWYNNIDNTDTDTCSHANSTSVPNGIDWFPSKSQCQSHKLFSTAPTRTSLCNPYGYTFFDQLPKVNCTVAFQDFMENMLANESTFENWQAQLATKITRSIPTEQSTTFRLLAAFLQKATPEVVAGFVKTLGSENDAKGPHMISLKLLAFLEETVGGLYTSTEESVKAMFVTKQPIFIEAFGDAVQFIPSPASMQQNMLDKLLEVGLPTLQMQTLASMSKLLKKDADDRASQSLKKTYQIESLAFTTIQFIAWDKANVVPAEYPLQAMASDVELASKMVEEVVAAHSNIKELEEGLKETIKQYICQFVVNAVFQRFSSFFTKVKDSENAIPQHFEQHMETKNVAQLKATVFSKKTHMANNCQHRKLCGNHRIPLQGDQISSPLQFWAGAWPDEESWDITSSIENIQCLRSCCKSFDQ